MKLVAISLRVDEARERRDALDQAWYRVLAGVGLTPVLIPNDVGLCAGMDGYLRSVSVSGLILTGGNDLAGTSGAKNVAEERDQIEGSLIEACIELNLPVLGVCRGFQMLAQFHGARPLPVANHVAKPHPIRAVSDSTTAASTPSAPRRPGAPHLSTLLREGTQERQQLS